VFPGGTAPGSERAGYSTQHARTLLRRVLKVLEAIGSRSAYFALLNENAGVRRRLIDIAAFGEFLITRTGAFVEYQEKEAWTWEHQALLHARAVAGDPQLRAEFDRVRADVLWRCVRRDTLREEVRNMRERMRREFSAA
jgi:glutamine synthetase adenylyltransferase